MKNHKIMALGLLLALGGAPASAEELRSRMLIDDTMSESRVLEIVGAAQAQALQPGNAVSLNLQVQFAYDDSRLTPSSVAVLNRVAAGLRNLDTASGLRPQGAASGLLIEAHTDSRGSQAYNLDLSKRRAEAVLLHLIGAGVDASRMTAVGYGEMRPLPGINPADGLNRRAEILFVN